MSKNNVKTFTEDELHFTEDNQLREKYINRTEVLDKVKELFLIPELECMTVVQIAEYYGVDTDAIKKQYQRNEDEFVSDGSTVKTSLFFKEFFNGTKCPIKTERGKITIHIDDNTTLVIPSRGIRIFPKRAILRMGNLKQRGNRKPPYISQLQESEWECFYKSAAAIMQMNNIEPSEIFAKIRKERVKVIA